MLSDLLNRGGHAIRNNVDLFMNGTLVKKAPTNAKEKLASMQYNKLWGGTKPLSQDKLVSGFDAIRMSYTNPQTGYTERLFEDGIAAGALVATGLVAFKATQGGVSLLTGGSG